MTDDAETIENVASGVSITAKLKRGESTRDQDTLKIKAKGRTADEAIENMDATLERADEWADELRAIQPGEDAEAEE